MKHFWINVVVFEKTVGEAIGSFDFYNWLSLDIILLNLFWLWLRLWLWIIINQRASHGFLLHFWLRNWLLLIGINNPIGSLVQLLNIVFHLVANLIKSLIDASHSTKQSFTINLVRQRRVN